jgi:hypothetical protein
VNSSNIYENNNVKKSKKRVYESINSTNNIFKIPFYFKF